MRRETSAQQESLSGTHHDGPDENSRITKLDSMATMKHRTFDHMATTRLAEAIERDDVAAAEHALLDGANPNRHGPYKALNQTSLVQDAITAGSAACLALLLKHGARRFVQKRRGWFLTSGGAHLLPLPLQAISQRQWQCLDVLIDAGRCTLFEPLDRTSQHLTPAAALLQLAGLASTSEEAILRLQRLCGLRRIKPVEPEALTTVVHNFVRYHLPDRLDLLKQCGIDSAVLGRIGEDGTDSGPEVAWKRWSVSTDGACATIQWMRWFGEQGIFWPEAGGGQNNPRNIYNDVLLDARRAVFAGGADRPASKPRPGL